jgi:proteasome activator subunit 4
MTTFLPLSHPQIYLPMMFRAWEAVNSYMYDERMLHFLSKLSEMHVAPDVSDPRKIADIPDDECVEGEGRPQWSQHDLQGDARWAGLYKDVGIYTEHEWNLLMCKCLASMGKATCSVSKSEIDDAWLEIPLADSGSLTTGTSADSQVGFEVQRLPKPNWRICA